ncbi:MAG: DUF2304 domain-containing protein [Ilumatobacteraceae bacterium]
MIAVVVAAAMLFVVLRQVRHRRLRAKYALLWLSVAVALVLLAVIPDALDRMATAAGVSYAPALLLVIGFAFFVFVCLHFSTELSRLEERTRLLAEEVALLREQTNRRSGADRAVPLSAAEEQPDADDSKRVA